MLLIEGESYMLYVLFTRVFDVEGVNLQVNSDFDVFLEPSWLNDDISRQIIKYIDGATAVKDYYIEDKHGRAIPPQFLSGGSKGLILIHKTNYITNLTKFGNNCAYWLMKLAEEKDVVCKCSNPYWEFDDVEKIEAICLNDGRLITNILEWEGAFMDFIDDRPEKEQEKEIYSSMIKHGLDPRNFKGVTYEMC